MAGLPRRAVRLPDGRIEMRLGSREREILAGLLEDLGGLLAADAPPDAALVRLHPPAVPGDPRASAEFDDLVRSDLDDDRQARLAVVAATLEDPSLDEGQATAWLGVLNDLRLIAGTRLGITEENEREPIDESGPDAERLVTFAWLGWLEEQLVDALASGLPDVPAE